MTPLFQKTNPIQSSELAGYQTALQNTQGNILKGHGRNYTNNLFLTFSGDESLVRMAIRTLAADVTSADGQAQQIQAYKSGGTQSMLIGFGLSSDGYRYMGYDLGGFSAAFADGMARANSGLGDPPTTSWEAKFQTAPHAMILLAHNDPAAIAAKVAAMITLFSGIATVATEPGIAIFNGQQPKEQFGFVDGVSQPIFFQSDVPATGPGQWDASAGTNLVLVRDPLGASDDDCGSYFVFRKLAQDVAGFRAREAILQGQLDPGQNPELAGASVVGRFWDGTPVALYPSPQNSVRNDFLYTGSGSGAGTDPYEIHCPFSSHIRKINPRGDTGDLTMERTHRIARRGITYGIQGTDSEVGLLFQCCQSSLEMQFEFLQSVWMNHTGAPVNDAGTDGVAGPQQAQDQVWIKTWGTPLTVRLDFGSFVTLKGGAYFFLPSLTFLRGI
jgi:Dyp-type peroxidase family